MSYCMDAILEIKVVFQNYILFIPSVLFSIMVFLCICHSRDVDGRISLDIFDEKLHPLSVRPKML